MDQSLADPVVTALQSALSQNDSPELRVALGSRLLDLGQADLALAEFETAVQRAPFLRPALEGAARAAEQTGQAEKAAAYRLSMDGPPAPPVTAAPPHLRSVPSSGDEEEAAHPMTLADVGGMDDVKERLRRAFLQPLRNPALYQRFNKRIGGGLLLYGPPGCGKTFIARAIAGEIGARFVNIGINDVLNMYMGESERQLHELFENARRRAPTLLFFDELDALGHRRSEVRGSSLRTTINQLLSEMDSATTSNDKVFVLGATNHPWDVDPALRRPGRFDQMLLVPPPDAKARAEILKLKLRGRPTSGPFDLAAIAGLTAQASGADLTALVETATELAIEKSLAVGRESPLTQEMLLSVAQRMRVSTFPWLQQARNYALYANEGGTYDELLPHLQAQGLG